MSATYIFRRVVSKILYLIVLVALIILTPVIKLLAWALRFAAAPLAIILTGIAVHFYFSIGFTPSELYLVLASVLIVLIKYAVGFVSDYLSIIMEALKDRVFTPLSVKPPVKYTI